MKRITIFHTAIVALLLLTIGSVAFAGNATANDWNNQSEILEYINSNESGLELVDGVGTTITHENDTITQNDSHAIAYYLETIGDTSVTIYIGAEKIKFNESVNITGTPTISPLTTEQIQVIKDSPTNFQNDSEVETYNSLVLDFTSENATLNEMYGGNLQWGSSVTKIDGNVVGTINGAIITEKRLIIIFASFALAIGTAALALGVSQSDKF